MHVLPGTGEAPTTGSPIPSDFESIVEAAANGEASAAERALLEAHPVEWRETLEDLLDDTEASLESVRAIKGPERAQVVADFEEEKVRLVLALAALTGTEPGSDAALAIEVPGDVRLQSSWADGRVVVWAGGPGTNPATAEELSELLDRAGAPPASSWVKHGPVTVPTGNGAPTLAIPVGDALGWLVAAGADAGQGTDLLGSSIRWLGRVAVWGVRLVAQGSIVPTLRAHSRRENGPSSYSVRWAPALVDRDELRTVAAAMPGTVGAVNPSVEGRVVALAVLGAVVDAIATKAAAQLDFAAPPPDPRNLSSTAEAFLTRLDGSRFEAPTRAGTELAKRLERWAKPATDAPAGRLVVQLDPPDKGDAWYLSVQGPNPDGRLVPVEVAIVDHRALADQLTRLERLLPLLRRPGGKRVGEVVLNQAEAWELMTVTGPTLEAAGFTVRVPALSRRKPSPSLRLSTDPSTPSVVGAHQLTAVSWSALFDDVELTAAEIHRLAAEARPLVRSHGAWVELDKADLAEAAAALAERASVTQLTGAEVLRHAIGLEGSHLAGTVQVHGGGWAADLLAKSADVASDLTTTPPGFEGELRVVPGRGARLAGLPRLGRARRLPGARHGSRQDADDPGAPGTQPHRAPRAGHRPAGGRRQLGGRGRPLHAQAARRGAPRRLPRRRRRARRRVPQRRRGHLHLRHGGARHRRAVDPLVGPARARRGAGHQERRQRDRPAAPPPERPGPHRAHGHAHRERPRRPVGHPRLHQPGPGRARAARSSRSCRPRARAAARAPSTRSGRSTASSCSAAPRASPRWPPSCPSASTSSTTAP